MLISNWRIKMTHQSEIMHELLKFYQNIIKPFSFQHTLFEQDVTVHVFLHSASKKYSQGIVVPYACHIIIVNDKNPPITLSNNDLVFCEKELVSKESIFHDNESMMDNVIKRIKKYIENKKKKIITRTWDEMITNKPYVSTNKLSWCLLYDGYKDNDDFIKDEIKKDILSRSFLSFIDRITCNPYIKGERKEWLPEHISEAASKFYDLEQTVIYKLKIDKIESIGDNIIEDDEDTPNKDEFDNHPEKFNKWDYVLDYAVEETQKRLDVYDKMPIDWTIISAINSNNFSVNKNDWWVNKYRKYALSPSIEINQNGEKKVINPRREFFLNYPVIANNPYIMKDEVFEKIDNLEPLNGIHFRAAKEREFQDDIDFKFTKSVMKYLNGRYLPEGFDSNLILSVLSHFPVERMPELPDRIFSSTYETDDLKKVIIIISNINVYIERPDHLFYMLCYSDIDCTFSEYLERIAKAYFAGKKYVDAYTVINNAINVSGHTFSSEEEKQKYDTYIQDYIKKNPLPKTISEREKIYDKYVHELKEAMPDDLKEKLNSSFPPKNTVEKYIREKYMMIVSSKDVAREIFNIKDSIQMFNDKVINPICVLLSNKTDSISIFTSLNLRMENLNLFTDSKSFSIPKLLKVTKLTHDRGEYFSNAGNKPATLENYNNGYDSKKQFAIFSEILQKDQIRRQAQISTNVEWSPLILEAAHYPEQNTYVIPLLSEKQLKDEGVAMNNCVGWGGYASRSSYGTSKIFSIRDENLERIATLELSPNINKKEPRICQLYGHRNSQPSPKVTATTKWLVDSIKNGEIKSYYDDIENEINSRESTEIRNSVISHKAGYMPSEENIRDAMIPWKTLLPAKLYNAPFEEWMKFDFIAEKVKIINEKKPLKQEIKKIKRQQQSVRDDLM